MDASPEASTSQTLVHEPVALERPVRRTYGRPKPVAKDSPKSSPVAWSIDAPTALAEAIVLKSPSSSPTRRDSDNDDDSGLLSKRLTSTGTQWAWTEKLKDFDNDSDDDAKSPSRQSISTKKAVASPRNILRAQDNSVFNTHRAEALSSPTKDPTSSPLSSQKDENSFNSLVSRSGSKTDSPPTSPTEPPPANMSSQYKRVLSESPGTKPRKKSVKRSSDGRTQTKIKRPTKKEQEETRRTTARMRSDLRVHLNDGDVSSGMPISLWANKFAEKHVPKPTEPTPLSDALSDPISVYSSSSKLDPDLALAAAPSFNHDPKRRAIAPKKMNSILLERSRQQGEELRKRKEQEFVELGGKLKSDATPAEAAAPAVSETPDDSDQGESSRPASQAADMELDPLGSEEDDDEYQASDDEQSQADDEPTEPEDNIAGPSNTQRMNSLTLDDEEDEVMVAKHQRSRKARRVESDDEEPALRNSVVLVPGTSMVNVLDARKDSPVSVSPSESERDKENSPFRAYDTAEDKENRAAPRFLTPSRRRDETPLLTRRASEPGESREVLGVLDERIPSRVNSPLSMSPPRSVLARVAARTQQTQKSAIDGIDGIDGFSQLFAEEEPEVQVGRMRGLFADAPYKMSQTDNHLRDLGHLSTQERVRGDEILARDLARAIAAREPSPPPQWFMNEKGLMTQTRPRQPDIPFSQELSPSFLQSQITPRRLETPNPRALIDADFTFSTQDEATPLRRVRRPAETPRDHSDDEEPAQPQRPKTAYDLLKKGATKEHKHAIQKAKQKPSEFVEAEAQESDEEVDFSWGRTQQADEEDAENESDAPLEGLVDDTTMDAETQAADLVLEKHKEHLEQDDAEIQKLHEQAIAGKLRTKRRDRGVGYEDSDSEDEVRRPRHFDKRRKIDGDNLPALAKIPDMQAFLKEYQHGLEDEDIVLREVSDEDVAGDEEDEDPPETVSASRLQEELREAARKKTIGTGYINADDLSWLDGKGIDEETEIRILPMKKPVFKHPLSVEQQSAEQKELQRFLQEHGQSRNNSNVRRNVAAVTGHGSRPQVASSTEGSKPTLKKGSQRVSRLGTALMLAKKGSVSQ